MRTRRADKQTHTSLAACVGLLCLSLHFTFCGAYSFDFSAAGPGVDYTGSTEPYQLLLNTTSWKYCSREADEFHKDFWGFYCAELAAFCIEVYDENDQFLYPGCARGNQRIEACTDEQALIRNCSSDQTCKQTAGVKDMWNGVEAVRLFCEEESSGTECTADEKTTFCPGASDCRKTQEGDVANFLCFQSQIEQWNSAGCGEDQDAVCVGGSFCSRLSVAGTPTTECACQNSQYGDGTLAGLGCTSDVWTWRAVLKIPRDNVQLDPISTLSANWVADRHALFELLFDAEQPRWRKASMQHDVIPDGINYQIEVTLTFPDEEEARAAETLFRASINSPPADKLMVFGVLLDTVHLVALDVFADNSASNQKRPTGLDVTSVTFGYSGACGDGDLEAGCWVVDFTFTLGDGFNLLYIPRAEGDDSGDFDYSVIPAGTDWETWNKAPADMYLPEHFPCTTADFEAGGPRVEDNPSIKITACCLPEFLDLYRPIESFDPGYDWGLTLDKAFCDAIYCESDCTDPAPELPVFATANTYPELDEFPMPVNHLEGTFKGLGATRALITETVDPYLKQYKGRAFFDELELRREAGIMEGTAGVEYVVDTFIGIAEFLPTGSNVLDTFMKQIAIHVEKTEYFTITTHGENEYTYIEYINVRLVEVMAEDTNETLISREQTFLARESNNVAHYAQLTFTVDEGYRVKEDTELIPTDSLRVGQGAFLPEVEATMHYPCREYLTPDDANVEFDADTRALFDSRFPQSDGSQSCAPAAAMCDNPASIPDQFVSFNVPLGIDWIPDPSANLDSIVFIHTVVQVEKTARASTATSAEVGELIKTVLSVAMPVVPGGVNIFCDSIVARTDLKQVADALIIVGSASDASELTRLRIVGGPGQPQSIANSVTDPADPVSINSSSIEAGLMTLVVLGRDEYFARPSTGDGQRPQSTLFGINLEDVITIHIMEQHSGFTTPGGDPTRFAEVVELVNQPGESHTDASGNLNTLGYKLNGAFRFTVDRRLNTASLEPTDELLEICGWRATSPTTDNFMSTTCILRRDIHKQVPVPTQGETLAWNSTAEADFDFDTITAIELPSEVEARNGVRDDEMGSFMQTVLGESDYSQELGPAFASVVAREYELNGQFKRAWWVNPGYDWVPSQTAGRRIFQLSQKLLMFALFNLDENGGIDNRRSGVWGRRQLLSNVPDASGAGMSTTSLVYNTNLLNNLATALGVPKDQVGSWTVTMQLSVEEECMSKLDLEASMRRKFVEYLMGSASQVKMVQIMSSIVRTSGEVVCSDASRRSRALLPKGRRAEFSDSTAELDTIVAFNTADPYLDKHKFLTMPAVLDLQELLVPAVITVTGDDPEAPPPPPVSPNSDSTTVILVTAFSLVSGTICTLLGMWACRRWRKRLQEEEEYDKEGARGGLEGAPVAGLTLHSVKDEILKDMEGREGGNGQHRGSVVSSDASIKF